MSEDIKKYKIDGRPSTIFRTVKNKDNPYVMIDRRPIDNPGLSFKAKGILTYLLSRPDGWEVSITDLVKHGQEGEAAIRSGMKELREAGHMAYETSRKEGRITGWLIRVFEVPQIAQVSPDSDFQEVENLQVENQEVENRTQVLSTLSSTDSKQDITLAKNPPLTIENQIYAGQEKIVIPPLDDWSAKRDIAAMQIIRMGMDLEPLAVAAIDALKIIPSKRDVKGWALALREMRTGGVTPSIITQAAEKLRDSGMTVADPFGLKKTALFMAAKTRQPAAQGMTYEY